MFFEKIDFLSPEITLFHNGKKSHSSWMSDILSLIQILVLIFCWIYYSLDLIKHREPKSYYFSRFVENAGFFPVNCSSLFHFISISFRNVTTREEDFDFLSFRIIGIDTYFKKYLDGKNVKNIDHWLYGKCNNYSVTKLMSTLITSKNFKSYENLACVTEFYDSKLGKYFRINEENFRWPNLSFGVANPKGNYYSVFIDKCNQESLDELFGKGKYKCKNDEEIKYFLDGYHLFHFNFINQDIDVLNYKEPNKKYIYTIENTIDQDNLSVNHINLNPVTIKTHDGIVLEKSNEAKSYTFERNDEFTYNEKYNDIYMIYNLWLKNRMQCYDRTYKKIQDVISDIGGVAQAITYIAAFLNSLFNQYKTVLNVEKIIFPYLKFEEVNKK